MLTCEITTPRQSGNYITHNQTITQQTFYL